MALALALGPGMLIPSGAEAQDRLPLLGPHAVIDDEQSAYRCLGSRDRAAFADCLRSAGASEPAIRAAATLSTDGAHQYVIAYVALGPVDLAVLRWPAAGVGITEGFVLGNSEFVPAANFLQPMAARDAASRALALRFPGAAAMNPVSVAGHRYLPDGSQRFILTTPLTDGCRACEVVAIAMGFVDIRDGRVTGSGPIGWAAQEGRYPTDSAEIRRRLYRSDVRTLQTRLNLHGYLAGPMDGAYGPMSIAALQEFRREHCLGDNADWTRETADLLTGRHGPDLIDVAAPCGPGPRRGVTAGDAGGRHGAFPLRDGVYARSVEYCEPSDADFARYGDAIGAVRQSFENGIMHGYESSCRVDEAVAQDGRVRVRFACSGEGERWSREGLFENVSETGFTAIIENDPFLQEAPANLYSEIRGNTGYRRFTHCDVLKAATSAPAGQHAERPAEGLTRDNAGPDLFNIFGALLMEFCVGRDCRYYGGQTTRQCASECPVEGVAGQYRARLVPGGEVAGLLARGGGQTRVQLRQGVPYGFAGGLRDDQRGDAVFYRVFREGCTGSGCDSLLIGLLSEEEGYVIDLPGAGLEPGIYAEHPGQCPFSTVPAPDISTLSMVRPLTISEGHMGWDHAGCEILGQHRTGQVFTFDLACQGEARAWRTRESVTRLSAEEVLFRGVRFRYCGPTPEPQRAGPDGRVPLPVEEGVYAALPEACPAFDGTARSEAERIAASLRVTLRGGRYSRREQSCPIAEYTEANGIGVLGMDCMYGDTPVRFNFSLNPRGPAGFEHQGNLYRLCPEGPGRAADSAPFAAFRLAAGFLDPVHAARQERQLLGVELHASAGTPVPAPIAGMIAGNRTGTDAPAGERWLILRDPETGREHIFGHLVSPLQPGDSIGVGEPLGEIAAGEGGGRVHWGINRLGIWQAVDAAAGWGWGTGPADASPAEVAARGWIAPEAGATAAEGAATAFTTGQARPDEAMAGEALAHLRRMQAQMRAGDALVDLAEQTKTAYELIAAVMADRQRGLDFLRTLESEGLAIAFDDLLADFPAATTLAGGAFLAEIVTKRVIAGLIDAHFPGSDSARATAKATTSIWISGLKSAAVSGMTAGPKGAAAAAAFAIWREVRNTASQARDIVERELAQALTVNTVIAAGDFGAAERSYVLDYIERLNAFADQLDEVSKIWPYYRDAATYLRTFGVVLEARAAQLHGWPQTSRTQVTTAAGAFVQAHVGYRRILGNVESNNFRRIIDGLAADIGLEGWQASPFLVFSPRIANWP